MFVNLEEAVITVITLTKNSSKFLKNCLSTLLKASSKVKDLKIAHLIVDGHSSDNTLDIIKRESPSSIVYQLPPRGLYNAMNFGISLVSSSFICYVHSDDEVDENYFLSCRKLFLNLANRYDIIENAEIENSWKRKSIVF